MHASTRPLMLAFLIAALLLLPMGTTAKHHDDAIEPAMTVRDTTLPVDLRLQLAFAPDGTARVRGTIRQRGNAMPLLEAARGDARTVFADADGDGTAGLVRLNADFRDVETGKRVRVVLAPTEHDIDASGDYAVELQIDESGMIGDIRTVISAEAA